MSYETLPTDRLLAMFHRLASEYEIIYRMNPPDGLVKTACELNAVLKELTIRKTME